MKNVNFAPKYAQRILSSHKVSEKHNEQKVFYKKAVWNVHSKTAVLESLFE